MKPLWLIVFVVLLVSACEFMQPAKRFIIDPLIKDEAVKHNWIDPSTEQYRVETKAEFYRNDTLLPPDKDTLSRAMGQYCDWVGDSLLIKLGSSDGTLDGASKFYAWIHDGKIVEAGYFIWEHSCQCFKLNPGDTAADRVFIPCTDYDLTISHLPAKTIDDTVYGKISFKTADYYARDYYDTPVTRVEKYATSKSFYFRAINNPRNNRWRR